MAFKKILDLDCSTSVSLGGRDAKTNQPNPTQIEGYYLGARKVPSTMNAKGFTNMHVFQTSEGNVGVWGKTNLDAQLASVLSGLMTRVSFIGMVPTKKRPMFKYSVETDESNKIDTPDTAAQAAALEGSVEEYEDYSEESDISAEEVSEIEEPAPARAAAPKVPLSTPSAAARAQVAGLLKGRSSVRS